MRAALAGSGALFIDMKNEFDTLYNDYLDEGRLLSLAGFLAIVGLLAVTLRSARRLGILSCHRCSRPSPWSSPACTWPANSAAPAAPDRHAAHRRRRFQLRAVLRPERRRYGAGPA